MATRLGAPRSEDDEILLPICVGKRKDFACGEVSFVFGACEKGKVLR